MLRRNLPYKLLALAIAIIIWTYANEGQNNATKELSVPLDIRAIESGLAVTSAPPSVSVVFQGARAHVESVLAEPDAVSAYVSLKGKSAGRYLLPVNVKVPEGFMGLVKKSAVPREVSVVLEQRTERDFPVAVQFSGPPPVGYRFGSPQLSPDHVTASGTLRQIGAASQLIVAVDTRKATAGGLDDDFPVSALDKDGKPVRGLELSPSKVRLRLDLLKAPASRVVFVSPNLVGQPPFPFKVAKIQVSPESVAVTGRPEQLENVTTLKTDAIDVSGRTKSFAVLVRVVTPQGLALAENQHIRVTVSIASSEKGPSAPMPSAGD